MRFDYYATQAANNITPYPVLDVFIRRAPGPSDPFDNGSYVGKEFGTCAAQFPNPWGWTFIDEIRTVPYPIGGSSTPIPATLSNPVTVHAGETVGFYLVNRASNVKATLNPVPVTYSNADITLTSDRGRSVNGTNLNWTGALNASAGQRTFTGRVYYTIAPSTESCCRGTTCNPVASGSCTGTVAGSASLVVSSCGTGNVLATCCFADFNHDGTPSIDDLFIYLNAYFASSPWANVGGDGVAAPTIDDLFLYINAYFTGCQ